jgi:hypothetical protein
MLGRRRSRPEEKQRNLSLERYLGLSGMAIALVLFGSRSDQSMLMMAVLKRFGVESNGPHCFSEQNEFSPGKKNY